MKNKKNSLYFIIGLIVVLLSIGVFVKINNNKAEQEKLRVAEEQRLENEKKENEKKEKEKLDKIYKILESSTPYPEFDSESKELVSYFLDTEWDKHSDDVKNKFLNRRNEYKEYWDKRKSETLDKNKENKSNIQQIGESDKNKIKKDAEDKLKDKNVTSIDVLTNSTTGKAMLSIQLVGDILKQDVNPTEAKELCDEIYNRLKDITEEVTLELVDKKHQLISLYTNGDFEMK